MEEVCEHCPGGEVPRGMEWGGVCGSSLPSTQKKPTITGCKHPGPPLHQTSPPAWGLSCRATERRRPQPSRAIWPPPAPIHQTPVRVPGNSICMRVWDRVPTALLRSISLLLHPRRSAEDGSSIRGPATHRGHLDGPSPAASWPCSQLGSEFYNSGFQIDL